jgi:MioC protein
MHLTILVGTMTGTAKLVAEEIQLTFEDDSTSVEVKLMDDLGCAEFNRAGPFLICTSTYGQGDVPDNAKALLESLTRERPALSAVAYGIVALGDRTYSETFCFGGKRFDDVMQELGARRIGEVLRHDASAGTLPEEVVLEWIAGWLEQARALCHKY